jgi:hypothetical protein
MTRAIRAAVVTLVLVMMGCKEDIPRPPPSAEDAGGSVMPTGTDEVDAGPAPTCGLGDQPCCPGNTCAGGGCCLGGRCIPNGTSCLTEATCLDGSCGGCGTVQKGKAQACCAGRVCTGSRTACGGMDPGMCQACGAVGQPCCGDGFCETDATCDRTQASPACVAKH